MPVSHKATGHVCAVLDVLLACGGWLNTKAVAEAAEVPRPTTRDILAELRTRHWVEHREADGAQLWCIGPELPRIGLAYLQLQQAAAQAAVRNTERALAGCDQALVQNVLQPVQEDPT